MASRRYESVCEDEDDFLLQHRNRLEAEALQQQLWDRRDSIAALVKHHLSLGDLDVCAVLPPESWVRGGFNMCIPVEVTKHRAPQRWIIFRCPMPHKHAETKHPGTVTEKLSCEMASHIWMQEFCDSIRIPHLYAFGFADGSHFTHIDHRPFHHRVYHRARRWFYRLFGFPLLSNYSLNPSAPSSTLAYSILEYIDPTMGQMLSITWPQHRDDPVRRNRLYQGLARIMLSLARIPQFSIGAYRFNIDGTISLGNRPLMCSTMIMENSGAPRTIDPQQTYRNVEVFASDMLTLHDQYLLHQPHAVRSADDAHARFAIRTLLRATSHHFTKTCQQDGPYILQLTDFHQSNIFVDDEWNVTALIDLEWICSLPAEMLSVPYWLTDCSIDGIIDEQYEHFDQARTEFLAIMDVQAEQLGMRPEHDLRLTRIMRESWQSKGVWFWACLRSINGWLFLFEDHIVPKFSTDRKLVSHLKRASALWQENIDSVVEAKLRDENNYQEELQALFKTF